MASSFLRSADSATFLTYKAVCGPVFKPQHDLIIISLWVLLKSQSCSQEAGHCSLLFCVSFPTHGESTLGMGSEMGGRKGTPLSFRMLFSALPHLFFLLDTVFKTTLAHSFTELDTGDTGNLKNWLPSPTEPPFNSCSLFLAIQSC